MNLSCKTIRSFICFILFFILSGYQGLAYKHLKTDDTTSIHILEVDPNKCRIFPVHANNRVFGSETVKNLAKKHQALAGINGGFFKGAPLEGMPSGILKIDHVWYAFPVLPRGAIGWSQDGKEVNIDQVLTESTIQIAGQIFSIDGFNRPRMKNEIILYSPLYSASTLTTDGLELVIVGNTIKELKEGGNGIIPLKGYILSIAPERITSFWKNIKKETPVKLNTQVLPSHPQEGWNTFSHIVGGTPVLIREGRIIKDFSSEKTTVSNFLKHKHARTAVGILPNGHWLFVVVDGSRPLISPGMTMPELAQLMFELGCQAALNLDGGSSSTMVLDDKVVNELFWGEDKISNAVLIKELQ